MSENVKSDSASPESLWQSAIDAAPVGLALVSFDGRLLQCNGTLGRLLGHGAEALRGRSLDAVIHPGDRETLKAQIRRLAAGEADRLELKAHLVHKDGTVFNGRLVASLVREGEGQPRHALCVVEDVENHAGAAREPGATGKTLPQAEAELLRAREELRALSQRIDEIREEERTVLARELHDELGHSLNAIKLDVAWLIRNFARGKEAASDSLVIGRTQIVMDTLDKAITFTQDMSSRLRPGVLDEMGLIPALEWLVQDFKAQSNLPCEFKCMMEECAMGAAQSTALFRICQELLTNVARHAFATRVVVKLQPHEGGVLMEVTDNGRGIPAEKVDSPQSLGLVGIRQRVGALAGEFRITGEPGRFTRARVWAPLQGDENAPKKPAQE